MSLIGKPVLLDHMNGELGARVVELIAEDNERAQRRKLERAAKKARKDAEKKKAPRERR